MNILKKSRKDCISSDIFYIIKNNLPDNYVIKDCLGQGAFGSVLLICDKNKTSDCKALKVVKIKKREQLTDFLDEIKYGRLFSKYGLGPEIFDTLLLNRPNGKKLGIIVMEKIDITLEKFLREYLGLQINSRYLGGVEISGANQNKLIDDIWFQNELKSIRKQLRQLGGATNIHSIRADFNDNSVKLRLTFKDTYGFGFAGKRKLRDDAQNLLRELGYDNRKVSIDY